MDKLTSRLKDLLPTSKAETLSIAQGHQAHIEKHEAYGKHVERIHIIVNLSPNHDLPDRIVCENHIIQDFSYTLANTDECHVQVRLVPLTIPGDEHLNLLEGQLVTSVDEARTTRAAVQTISLQPARKLTVRSVLALYRKYQLQGYHFHSRGTENDVGWHRGSRYWK